MNIIDAYLILENYVNSLAQNPKTKEYWKRASTLKNTKEEIRNAYKLVFTHALFWNAIPNDILQKYHLCLNHLDDFFDDETVAEHAEIQNVLNNKNPFTKLRNKLARASLEQKKQQIEAEFAQAMMRGFMYGQELDEYIDKLLPMIENTKKKLRDLPDEELNKRYFNTVGYFVCDAYTLANIERDYNDTEYFWPFEDLLRLSNDPQFDYLFGRYKAFILRANQNVKKIGSPI